MARETWEAHLALVLASLTTSGYHVVTKIALSGGINQLVFCVYRDLIALSMLIPMAYFKERRLRPPLSGEVILSFFILGLSGIFANQLLFVVGLNFTSPATSAALQPSIPIFTFIFALLIGAEKLNWKQRSGKAKIGGSLLCISGAALMIIYQGPAIWGNGLGLDINGVGISGISSLEEHVLYTGLNTWYIGTACLVGNCASMGFYISFQAPVLVKYPAGVSVTAFSYLFGAGLMLLVCGFFGANSLSAWVLTYQDIFAVFYAGVLASGLNYCLLTFSNKILGPSLVALYIPLMPVFSSVLSHFFLGSSVFLGSVIGGMLIIGGLYMVTWSQKETWHAAVDANEPHLQVYNIEEDNSLHEIESPLLKGSG